MKTQISKKVMGAAIIFFMAIVMVGFSSTTRAADTVTIGAAYSTGGPGGRLGGELLLGARLATKYYNDEKGGLNVGGKKYQIKLLEYNSNTNPQEGISVVKRMIEKDRVPIIIGDCISGVIIAQQPVVEKAKWPWIMNGSAANLTTEGFKYTNRNNMTDALVAPQFWKGALDSMGSGKKKVAILAIATEYGKSKVRMAKEYIPKSNGEVVFEDTFAFKTTDFYPVLTKLKTLNPDAVYMPNYGELATMTKQAKEIGFKTVWLTDDTVEPAILAKLAGDAAIGIKIYSVHNPAATDDAHKVYSKYIIKEKGPLAIYATSYALGWDTAIRAFMALEKAESLKDPAKISKAIREIDWNGASTQGKFDETGQIDVTGYVIEIVKPDGACKLVSAGGELVK